MYGPEEQDTEEAPTWEPLQSVLTEGDTSGQEEGSDDDEP